MDGRTDDGWMDDGQTNERWMDGGIVRQKSDGWVDREGQMIEDRQMNGWMNGLYSRWIDRWMDEE